MLLGNWQNVWANTSKYMYWHVANLNCIKQTQLKGGWNAPFTVNHHFSPAPSLPTSQGLRLSKCAQSGSDFWGTLWTDIHINGIIIPSAFANLVLCTAIRMLLKAQANYRIKCTIKNEKLKDCTSKFINNLAVRSHKCTTPSWIFPWVSSIFLNYSGLNTISFG